MELVSKIKKFGLSYLILLIAVLSFLLSAYFALNQYTNGMWAFLISGIFLCLFGTYRLSTIKVGPEGLEAKMGGLLRDAETTIEELQELTKTVCSVTLSLVKRNGRFSTFSPDEEKRIEESTRQIMEKIKITSTDIEAVFFDWHKFTYFDYINIIFDAVNGFDLSTETVKAISEYRSSSKLNDAPTPDEIKTFLTKHKSLNDNITELIEDYRFYRENKRHHDEGKWFKISEQIR